LAIPESGLHPTHIGQHKDAITKSLVQWGFSAQILVSVSRLLFPQTVLLPFFADPWIFLIKTKSFSAHHMIYRKLRRRLLSTFPRLPCWLLLRPGAGIVP
jgi:hypothetical protein